MNRTVLNNIKTEIRNTVRYHFKDDRKNIEQGITNNKKKKEKELRKKIWLTIMLFSTNGYQYNFGTSKFMARER